MCEIISEEKLKAILDEVSSQEIAKLAYDNWFPQMKKGMAIIDLETGEVKGLSLAQNEYTSPDFYYVELYRYPQDWDYPDADELLDDEEYEKFTKYTKDNEDSNKNTRELLEAFCTEEGINLSEKEVESVAYWFDENHQYQNRDNWIYGILSQYNEYLPPFGSCKAHTKYDDLAVLYETEKKNIMQRVHKANAFGQTETQVTVFMNEIRLADHLTPALTQYQDDSDALFAFDVVHDPFISYAELDDIFYNTLVQVQHSEEVEAEEEALVPYNVASGLRHDAGILIKSAENEKKEDGSISEQLLDELENVKHMLENIKGELDPLTDEAEKVRGVLTRLNSFF